MHLGFRIIAATSLSLNVVFFVKSMYRKYRRQEEIEYQRAIFFPEEAISCMHHFTERHGCTNPVCTASHTYRGSSVVLFDWLLKTKSSLDIAMFSLTSEKFCELLLILKRKGVIIRIVTDISQNSDGNSLIGKLRKNGIKVVTNKTDLMHNKFIISDDSAVATGSMNWTSGAIYNNDENVVMTNSVDCVNSYMLQFWHLYEKYQSKLHPE